MTDRGRQITQGLAFLDTHARLLERRLAQLWFEKETVSAAESVLDALLAYRNDDGGLGFALEPDLRTPLSQPLAVDFGLEVAEQLAQSKAGTDTGLNNRLAGFAEQLVAYLEKVADGDGGLRIVLPSAAAHPRASHWGDCEIPAGLNPTAGVTARLRSLGATGNWLDTAEEYCRTLIDRQVTGVGLNGHTVANVLRFLDSAPDTGWASSRLETVAAALPGLEFFHLYPGDGYGLTPLDLAPSPDDPRRALFPADAVAAHLDALAGQQQEDGGWPVSWQPPGPAAKLEWRGVRTLQAIRVLALNS